MTEERSILSRRTPYNDSYETCERTLAELRIYGNDLEPREVTERLGVEPTSSQRKDDSVTSSLGRRRTFKAGGWFLSSEDRVQSKDLRRHLDWLLALIVPRAQALRSLQEVDGIRMNVTCIWWSAAGDGGPTLWPEQMRAMADLNLECVFEIAFYGDPDVPAVSGGSG